MRVRGEETRPALLPSSRRCPVSVVHVPLSSASHRQPLSLSLCSSPTVIGLFLIPSSTDNRPNADEPLRQHTHSSNSSLSMATHALSQTDILSLPATSDTKLHVVALYQDRPHYACARCSAVIVRRLHVTSRICALTPHISPFILIASPCKPSL